MALEPEVYASMAARRVSELTFPGSQKNRKLLFETDSCRVFGHMFSCTKRCRGTIDGWVSKEYLNESSPAKVIKTERIKYSIIPQYQTMAMLQKVLDNGTYTAPDKLDYIPVPPGTERAYIYEFINDEYVKNMPDVLFSPYCYEAGVGYEEVSSTTDDDGCTSHVAYFPETCTEGEIPGTFKVWVLHYGESTEEDGDEDGDARFYLEYISFMPNSEIHQSLYQSLWRCEVKPNGEIISENDWRYSTFSPFYYEDENYDENETVQRIYERAFSTYICHEEELFRIAEIELGKDW